MDETQKRSFVLYSDLKEPLQDLTDDQVGKLFRAVFDYVDTGTEPDFTGTLKLAFSFVRISLDRNLEKYKQTVERRRAAGRAGGLASAEARRKKAEEEAKNAENPQANPTDSSNRSPAQRLNHVHVHVPDNVHDNVHDNDPVHVSVSDSDPVHVPVGTRTDTDDTDDAKDDFLRCEVCGRILTEGVASYSRDRFGRLLCQKCQVTHGPTAPPPPKKTCNYYGEKPDPAVVRAAYQRLLAEEAELEEVTP